MSLTSEVVWRDHVFHGNLVVNFSLCISSVSGKNSWSCLIHNFQQLSQFGLLSLSTIIVLVALFQSMHVQYFCQKCLLAIFPQTRIVISLPKFGLRAGGGLHLFSLLQKNPHKNKKSLNFTTIFGSSVLCFGSFFHCDSFRFYFS